MMDKVWIPHVKYLIKGQHMKQIAFQVCALHFSKLQVDERWAQQNATAFL